MTTARAHRQIGRGDGTNIVKLFGVEPDVHELLAAHITAGQRELHAGVQVSVRRDIACRVTGAAR